MHAPQPVSTAPHDRIAGLEARVQELEAATETLTCELTRALLRGMQDATSLAEQRIENAALIAKVRELSDKVVRGAADQARLRRAVINARPRITETVQRLDRPYVSHVQIPYPVPVQSADTTNEVTQQLPILDLPEPGAWRTNRLQPLGSQAA